MKTIRNIGIAAHIDAGKTTLTERILFFTGKTHKIGEVHNGEAVMDYLSQEKERGITITSAVTTVSWKKHEINIVDTPGHVDFTVEVERCMRVMDGAVIVLCAVGGVEPQTETVWEQINKYKIPRIIFINKLDRIGADFYRVINEIKKKLNIIPLPLTLPIGSEKNFSGIIDMLEEKEVYFSEDGKNMVFKEIQESKAFNEKKENLIETLAEHDIQIMGKYINGDKITNEDILNSIKLLTYTQKIVPIFCGSALKNKGIQHVLNGIINFLPSPDYVKVLKGYNKKSGEKTEFQIPDNEFLGYIFKVQVIDKRKICYVRVYSGSAALGESIFNSTTNKSSKLSKIFRIHANKREEIKSAKKGNLVGMLLKDGNTGDTITKNIKFNYILEKIEISNPVISLAIEPYSIKDQDYLLEALEYISIEDPSFQFKFDEDVNQILISGMGELHLEIVVNRLLEEFKLKVKTGRPQVVYRETITTSANANNEYSMKIEDDYLYAYVSLEVIPLKRTGKDFSNKIIFKSEDSNIPDKVFDYVKDGLKEAFLSGFFNGAPVIDTKVIVKKIFDKTSKYEKGAFKVATINAFKEAYLKAKPILLEPIMEVIVNAPDEFTGDIIGYLNSKKSKILNVESENSKSIIICEAYLSSLFGFTTTLRSLTKGKGNFTMKFLRYDQL